MRGELNNLEWFKTGFETYNPIHDTLLKIESNLKNYAIDVIIDVNCKDVQFLIPKLFKTLYLCKVSNFKVYYVDKNTLPVILNESLNRIEKVPTIFFSEKGVEKFRIVEQIVFASSIEKEIETLLSRN